MSHAFSFPTTFTYKDCGILIPKYVKNLSTYLITMLLASVILLSCKKTSSAPSNNNNGSVPGNWILNFGNVHITGVVNQAVFVISEKTLIVRVASTAGNDPNYSSQMFLAMPSNVISLGSFSTLADTSTSMSIDSLHANHNYNISDTSYSDFDANIESTNAALTYILDTFNTTTKHFHYTFSGTVSNFSDVPSISGSVSGIATYQ
jgi:hypothetical protein